MPTTVNVCERNWRLSFLIIFIMISGNTGLSDRLFFSLLDLARPRKRMTELMMKTAEYELKYKHFTC